VKICDVTQFYSPLSGGVKRYLHEKASYIEKHSSNDQHVLIVPGGRTETKENGRSRVYTIHSPLLSRTSRYRALLNLRAVESIFERERPDIIECGDPYQLGWKSIASAGALRIPAVGFYHSHFPEAYLRSTGKYLGRTMGEALMDYARRYVRNLYNRFEATLVPSARLAEVLCSWGVTNTRVVSLGVNTEVFSPAPTDGLETRASLGIPNTSKLLLYVGRLSKEKNTQTLCQSFDSLERRRPNEFHLLVIGDGPERDHLHALRENGQNISWIRYCSNSLDLARYYRAADLFVHPGVEETFGLVALESQACGTPVVGIRGSYMDRIIFHEQESWARENSAGALTEAIEELSTKKLSMLGGGASRAAGELYSWPRVFDQLFCIYREICANYRGQRDR
jgi:alpha-1,6-mannosyltransferase